MERGGGTRLSPPGAEPRDSLQGREGGSLRELVRFLGEILADESGLAGVSVRPAPHGEQTVNPIAVAPRGAVTRFGEKGHTCHAACAELASASRTTVPRGTRRGPRGFVAGAILKPDPQPPSPSVCGRRRPLRGGPSSLEGGHRGRGGWQERQPGETGQVPSAACAAVTQHRPEAFLRMRPPRGAGLTTLVPRARARGAEVTACTVGTPQGCAMPARGHRGGRRSAAQRQ